VALFIDVKVDPATASDAELGGKLVDCCPVDIFARSPTGALEIVEENLDECTLCELCLAAAPPGAVRIVKLYDGRILERRES
jgi:NAD-dependent dihydropyrimidine dehydrogenase PreA subunit